MHVIIDRVLVISRRHSVESYGLSSQCLCLHKRSVSLLGLQDLVHVIRGDYRKIEVNQSSEVVKYLVSKYSLLFGHNRAVDDLALDQLGIIIRDTYGLKSLYVFQNW